MSYLIIDCILLVLQFAVVTTNGFILLMFARVRRLHTNNALRLLLFVTIMDFLHGLTTLPYTIYLTAFCMPPINLNPYYIMISSTPFIVHLKIKVILTLAIALQRTMALFSPVLYRKLSLTLYAESSLLFGITFGCVDVLLQFALSPIVKSPDCGTIGCFVSDKFLHYWGNSNMILGIFVILFSLIIVLKIRFVASSLRIGTLPSVKESDVDRFMQANQTSMGILITSLLFITIPSAGVGLIEMIGFSIFRKIGPFYLTGLFCAGTCNLLAYVILNRDMSKLAKSFLTGNGFSS